MSKRPIVLVHGYSDSAAGFDAWREIIKGWDRPVRDIYVGNYVSLTNEVTIKDLAEGFDRALAREAGLAANVEFDAIVHSTGMLVVRSWLNRDPDPDGKQRRARLKHLIALAPATNGSPLAHKGRSWLGSIFKGGKNPGPDFLEAGDEILFGLELASRFTWDLAHDDLINDNARFKPGPETPFVFTFCGNKNYGFLHNFVTEEEGTDGTVRWAGCPLNSRKVTIKLQTRLGSGGEPLIDSSPWANQQHPLVLIKGVNHDTIMSRPPKLLQDLVRTALNVESEKDFTYWIANAKSRTEAAHDDVARWQQFVIRLTDERGDPVNDWNLQLWGRRNGTKQALQQFALDVHVYKRDPSIRCFHVNLDNLKPKSLRQLELRLIANSGTDLVAYHGVGSERVLPDGTAMNPEGKWDACIDLAKELARVEGFDLFYPFTTTFVELRVNREPMPMVGKNHVYWFV